VSDFLLAEECRPTDDFPAFACCGSSAKSDGYHTQLFAESKISPERDFSF
jgi:hypothetical protein